MKSLFIRADAEADVDDACAWYEACRIGLGHDFKASVEKSIEGILQFPKAAPRVHAKLRRAKVKRFPFGVFYLVEETRIVVVGVIHASRSPRVWKKRLP